MKCVSCQNEMPGYKVPICNYCLAEIMKKRAAGEVPSELHRVAVQCLNENCKAITTAENHGAIYGDYLVIHCEKCGTAHKLLIRDAYEWLAKNKSKLIIEQKEREKKFSTDPPSPLVSGTVESNFME